MHIGLKDNDGKYEYTDEQGNVYIQQQATAKNSCSGCDFYDRAARDCLAPRDRRLTAPCYTNDTIWIKKEQEMEEYTDKNGEVYVQKPDLDTECTGCAFNHYHESYSAKDSCAYSQAVVNCASASIIWVKKEQKMSAEVTKDYIEPKYIPKAGIKYDQEKERYDLVPVLALEEVAKVLTAGAHKYNEDYEEENWRKVPNATRRYFSATQRHLAKVRKGETHDNETKLHHYAHAITNLMFLLEKELENKVPAKD